MRGEKVFITGGCGFIGANLVKCLLDSDHCRITVYDNLSVGSRANLERAVAASKGSSAPVEFIQADILDKDRLSRAVKDHSAVVHLAAHTRVVESLENPQENFETNVIGTFNALEAARKNGVDKFIFASSNAAVGEQIPPINEQMVPRPLSPYGATKLYGEGLCSAYFHSYGLRTVSLRFANAYGPYSEHKSSVVAKFIKRVQQGKALEIYGDGNQTRDFIHAEDISQAIDLALAAVGDGAYAAAGEVFQIATGVETRIIDLAALIAELCEANTGTRPDIQFDNPRKGEIIQNFSDIEKARSQIHFQPQIQLETGLARLLTENSAGTKAVQKQEDPREEQPTEHEAAIQNRLESLGYL
jgi:UDP-glucose 4-epimerase